MASKPKLERGQEPIKSLVLVEKAHDVRSLRVCAVCESLGNKDSMIDDRRLLAMDGTDWYHGRCFVRRFGDAALHELPEAKTNRLTLGDLGVRLMKALINSPKKPANDDLSLRAARNMGWRV